ncbi:hypothetical protein MHBO_004269 [Bonamia ostreae]|uniref:Uncharacterized protein n=1 Tax=Bonamia ostreae TaxID=126728 RepID=A0ABV2AST9_9EUKA
MTDSISKRKVKLMNKYDELKSEEEIDEIKMKNNENFEKIGKNKNHFVYGVNGLVDFST